MKERMTCNVWDLVKRMDALPELVVDSSLIC
jgi:hypothetical protein